MAYIYAYAQDEIDTANIGLVGALLDQNAVFDLQAGEFGELTFKHPIDPWGKWEVLANGVLLKTEIPVRLVPEVDDGAYIDSVDVYKVSLSATKYQRYIYYAVTASKDPTIKTKKGEKTKHKKLLKKNTTVYVIENPRPADPAYRYKVRVGSGKKKVVGYMEKDGLTLIEQHKSIPQTQDGQEDLSASYAIQEQLFRIYAVDTEMDEGKVGTLTVRARRLAYDLLGNITGYKATTNVSCQQVCRGILNNTVFPHPFTVFSDIGNKHVGVDFRNRNPIEALIDPDDGVIGRWGGEVVCDDYDIYVLHHAGKNRGVRIRYGTNMQGIQCDADYSNVITAIRPIGEKANGEPLYLDGYRSGGVDKYNQGVSGTYNLPNGYRWAIDDDGNRKFNVIERNRDDGYAVPKAYVLEVNDAKVQKQHKNTDPSETSVLTTAEARVMLVNAAVDMFNAGCDLPEISMDVDFTLLGDTQQYAQYRHLESLFVYDDIEIRHDRLGITAVEQLMSLKWDIRAERVIGATFGSLGNAVAKIPGFSLPSINGGKILPGTITGGQLATDSVSYDHIQANSINSDVIMARSITGDRIMAGEIEAGHLKAHAVDAQAISAVEADINSITSATISTNTLAAAFANLFEIVANNIRAGTVTTDALDAVMASLVSASVGVLDVGFEHVKDLVADQSIIRAGEADALFIDRLSVTSANMVNAVISRLILVDDSGTDPAYYAVNVGSDGTINLEEVELSQEEIDAGQTSDGKPILTDTIVADDINGENIYGVNAIVATILTDALNAGQITATEALLASARIPALYTTAIAALGDTLTFSANQTIQFLLGVANNVNAWFTFGANGLEVRQGNSKWHTTTKADGFYIDHDEVAGHVGAFHEDTFEPRSIRMGRIIAKGNSSGGWSWNVAQEQA